METKTAQIRQSQGWVDRDTDRGTERTPPSHWRIVWAESQHPDTDRRGFLVMCPLGTVSAALWLLLSIRIDQPGGWETHFLFRKR